MNPTLKRAWRRNPSCTFCAKPTRLLVQKHGHKVAPDTAVLYHRRNRYDPERPDPNGLRSNSKHERKMLACRKCADEQSRAFEKRLGKEELQQRSGSYPLEVVAALATTASTPNRSANGK